MQIRSLGVIDTEDFNHWKNSVANYRSGYDLILKDLSALLNSDEQECLFGILMSESNLQLRHEMLGALYDLQTKKPSIDKKYWQDILRILQFMGHPNEVMAEIIALEDSIQAYAKTMPDEITKQLESFIFASKTSYSCIPLQINRCFKIVSGYFYQWAQSNGFSMKAKIVNHLDEQIFLSLLQRKILFKDSSWNVQPEHGMWTHMIQWHTVFQHQAKTSFLQHSPIELYQQYGNSGPWLWKKTFDLYDEDFRHETYKDANEKTFRNPEALTLKILHTHSNVLPYGFLAGTIRRQEAKIRTFFDKQQPYMKKLKLKHHNEAQDQVVYRAFSSNTPGK